MRKENKILRWKKLALLAAGTMLLCSCGRIDSNVSTEGTDSEVSNVEKNTADKSAGTTENADFENEIMTAEEESVIRLAKYADAVGMFYYGGMWPDGTEVLDYDWEYIKENQYAIYDVDGDGIEELILAYTTTGNAGMIEEVYEYNVANGEMHSELLVYPYVTYFSNGCVEAMWSHNQGVTTEMWPFDVYQYNADTDTYDYIASVDSWGKEEFPQDFDGNPFPDEYDLDGNGKIYYVATPYNEKQPMDDAEFEAWRAGVEQGGSALDIPYAKAEDESYPLNDYTLAYKKLYYQKYVDTYGESEDDIGLWYLQGTSLSVGDYKEKLENRYGLSFEWENEYGDSEIGYVNGEAPIILNYLNATVLIYQDTPVEDLTIFGIYPGMSLVEAETRLFTAGFYKTEDGGYITGDGMDNVSVWLEEVDGIVEELSIRSYCSYAG